jgi:hypothetical protein
METAILDVKEYIASIYLEDFYYMKSLFLVDKEFQTIIIGLLEKRVKHHVKKRPTIVSVIKCRKDYCMLMPYVITITPRTSSETIVFNDNLREHPLLNNRSEQLIFFQYLPGGYLHGAFVEKFQRYKFTKGKIVAHIKYDRCEISGRRYVSQYNIFVPWYRFASYDTKGNITKLITMSIGNTEAVLAEYGKLRDYLSVPKTSQHHDIKKEKKITSISTHG